MLSEPKLVTRWLSNTADFSPRKGAQYSMRWKDRPPHRGEILEFVPGRKITFSWSWPGLERKLKLTRVRLSVRRKGRGTIFKIEHSGFPGGERWVDLYAGAVWGWTYFAMDLKSVLETGTDLRIPMEY